MSLRKLNTPQLTDNSPNTKTKMKTPSWDRGARPSGVEEPNA